MRLAHISDLHLKTPGSLGFRSFIGRRVFGAANLMFNRANIHSQEVAEAALDAIESAGVDHCVVTGDVSNLALDCEFENARRLLDRVGGTERLTVIPGNHDYYTPGAVKSARFEAFFGDLLWPIGESGDQHLYPVHKDIAGVRLIFARSATIPPPMCAWGVLGDLQMDRIETLAREFDGPVVLAMHHNIHRQPRLLRDMSGRLRDRDQLQKALERTRIDLVIYGHDHHPVDWKLADGRTRVVSCGSTSLMDTGNGRFGRMNVYTFEKGVLEVESWQFNVKSRRFETATGSANI